MLLSGANMQQTTDKTESAGPQAVRMICLLLALVTLALYWPVRNFQFNNYDDAQYLTANPNVQNGLTASAIKWAFTTGYGSNWHPLTWISHLIDIQLFGWNAGAHHIVSVLFHIANTLLLFLLLRQCTGALWRPALVAALFAWHPLRAESVAWVAERKDVLSGFFWMLTLLAYAKYASEFKVQGSKFKVYYALALIFFALGLMAKPMLVSLPLIMLAMDYWPLGRIYDLRLTNDEGHGVASAPTKPAIATLVRLVVEKIPFFALTLASCVITFLVQQKGAAVDSLENVSLQARVANALVAYVRYLGKLFWPVDLAVPYPYTRGLPMGEVLAAAALLLAITVLALWLARSHPPIIVGWLWFVISLVPVIGLVQVGEQALADRYTYLPSIGIFLIVAWEVPRLLRVSGEGGAKIAVGACAALVLIACLLTAAHQIQFWRNSIALFTRAIEVTKNNATAECNLGAALGSVGKTDEAIAHERAALKIKPGYPEAESNLGRLLGDEGKTDEAISWLTAAIKARPEFETPHFSLGLIYMRAHHYDEAAAEFHTVTTLNPRQDQAHANLGIILAQRGRLDDAVAEYQQALAIAPNNAFAHNALGAALQREGKLDDAATEYSAAIAIKPDLAEACDNLGVLLMAHNDFREAEEQFAAAAKVQPDSSSIRCHLGNARLFQGNFAGAADEYATAVRLDPRNIEANFNYAIALTKLGRTADAMQCYRAVLRIEPDTEPALQKLAWILATDADEKVRNGTEAVELATPATKLSAKDALAWDTLAAAQAETGKFDDALASAKKALELAGDNKKLAGDIQRHLERFQEKKPYREAGEAGPSQGK